MTGLMDMSDVKSFLKFDENGKVRDDLYNYKMIFSHDSKLQGICFNETTRSIVVNGSLPWNSDNGEWGYSDWTNLVMYINEKYGIYSTKKCQEAMYGVVSLTRKVNPIKTYVESFEWDKTPRIPDLLIKYLGAEDTPYVRTVTVKTLVAAIARLYQPGVKFDNVLVLCGVQGIGKSTLFSKLGMKWYSDSMTIGDMKDKTAAEKLRGVWIMELSELAGLRKVEVETVKAFISRCDDQYREPYATYVQTHPRACILVGSTNTTDGFLRDITGNRRFWPVIVTGQAESSVWDLTEHDIGQIWAEALYRYKEGETLYLPRNIEKIAYEQQSQAMETDPRLGMVGEYLEATGQDKVCLMEIWCECFMRDRSLMKRRDAYELEGILQQLGNWEVYKGNSTGKTRIPGYGVQKTFVRKDSLTDQNYTYEKGQNYE